MELTDVVIYGVLPMALGILVVTAWPLYRIADARMAALCELIGAPPRGFGPWYRGVWRGRAAAFWFSRPGRSQAACWRLTLAGPAGRRPWRFGPPRTFFGPLQRERVLDAPEPLAARLAAAGLVERLSVPHVYEIRSTSQKVVALFELRSVPEPAVFVQWLGALAAAADAGASLDPPRPR